MKMEHCALVIFHKKNSSLDFTIDTHECSYKSSLSETKRRSAESIKLSKHDSSKGRTKQEVMTRAQEETRNRGLNMFFFLFFSLFSFIFINIPKLNSLRG